MVLSNVEIVNAINAGGISIHGIAGMDPREKPFNTTAVDLRLGNEIRVPVGDLPPQLDLRKSNIASFLEKLRGKLRLPTINPTR